MNGAAAMQPGCKFVLQSRLAIYGLFIEVLFYGFRGGYRLAVSKSGVSTGRPSATAHRERAPQAARFENHPPKVDFIFRYLVCLLQ